MSNWPDSMETRVVALRPLALPDYVQAHLTLSEWLLKIKRAGWKWHSSGAFASVYRRGKYVMKVAVNDYGYDAFLEVALSNQRNPYFPKIYNLSRYYVLHDEFSIEPVRVTVVVMERLRSGRKHEKSWNSFDLEEKAKGHRKFPASSPSKKEREAVRLLASLLEEFQELDLHERNVMFRGKQPVIIDPIAFSYKSIKP